MSSHSIRPVIQFGLTLLVAAGLLHLLTPAAAPVSKGASRSKLRTVFALENIVPDRVAPGVTLVPVVGTEEVLLLDAKGGLVNMWPIDAMRARVLPGCRLLAIHGTSGFGKNHKPWEDLKNVIREYDRDGHVVWEYTSDRVIHHDVQRLPGGNTVFLERTGKLLSKEGEKPFRLRYDIVKEVNSSGEIVSEWHAADHLDQSYCGWQGCESKHEKNRFRNQLHDWTHTNSFTLLPPNRFFDSGDKRFAPGNILLMPRNWWTAILIDKKTGKQVWEYEGDKQDKLMRGHEPVMIPEGYPGAGNILLFDNGAAGLRERSIVREINPATKREVWRYEADGFFSEAAGRAQRLENGNTLISEDRKGRVFEVSQAGEIVWDLQIQGHDTSRAERYGINHCE